MRVMVIVKANERTEAGGAAHHLVVLGLRHPVERERAGARQLRVYLRTDPDRAFDSRHARRRRLHTTTS